MRRCIRLCLVVAALGLIAGALAAQPPEPAKPGPEHDKLKAWEGDWDCAVDCKIMGKATGKANCKMDLGGFWLVMDIQGEAHGQKFLGKGSIGYDPQKQKYVSTWQSNMCPQLCLMTGEFSPDGKTYTQKGEMPGPDGKPAMMKNVVEFKGDTIIERIWKEGDNEPTTTITYTRKK
jgi:hypothetical protein